MRNAASRIPRCCSLQNTFTPPEQRRFRRVHGLQLPLHPQQVVGWVVLVGVAAGTFSVVVPVLGPSWQPLVSALLASTFTLHVAAHLTALLLDPADPQVRAQPSSVVVPEFDRTKHRHVIENSRCHLCNISTSSRRTKHCSICNKCISQFDHHCKWLNNCIGGRNYPAFIVSVVSAIVSAVAVTGVSITELSLINIDASLLSGKVRMDNVTLPVVTTPGTGSLIVISVVGILSAIAAVLLIHLCFFHGYIACLGLTTYEYVRNKREQHAANTLSSENAPSSEQTLHRPSFCNDEAKQPVRYHFCNSVTTKECSEVDTRNVYICSTHQQQTHGEQTGSGKERRNFHLYFSYETHADETSIEVSSQTILNDTEYNEHRQEPLEMKPSTPSPVSCCFSIINSSSTAKSNKQRNCQNGEPENGKPTRSCVAMRRIQTFLRTRLRRSARQRTLNSDLSRARKNKVNPAGSTESLKEKKDEKEELKVPEAQCIPVAPKELGPIQPRPPLKLPPLALPSRHRMKQVALAVDSLAAPTGPKRSQPPLRVRRTSFYKRPRFKMGPHVTQSVQLSPIPESELSKPASPRSTPQINHFSFPPCISDLKEANARDQTGIT